MKIVYCLPEISLPGGIGRITSIKANYLSSIGHDVYIVTTDDNNNPPYYKLNDSIRLIQFDINFSRTRKSQIIKRIRYRLQNLTKYKKLLSTFLCTIKADIVISTFNSEANFLYKINDGSKKILECHFNHDIYKCIEKYRSPSFINKIIGRYKTFENEKLVRLYDAFVVLTDEDAALWRKLPNMHIISNMNENNDTIKSKLCNKRVIAVGRLDGQKKFERLINIWKEVCKNIDDWHLDIFGQGPDENMLINLIKSYNLSDSITIHKPSTTIFNEYSKSSILAMTSVYEGWGLVLTEAMSCGVPCISYACKCGPKDIIKNGINGFCIEQDNKKDFVEKLLLLMHDKTLRVEMGRNASECSKQYNIEIVMKKWILLFNNLNRNE